MLPQFIKADQAIERGESHQMDMTNDEGTTIGIVRYCAPSDWVKNCSPVGEYQCVGKGW